MESTITSAIDELVCRSHENAVSKGWWDTNEHGVERSFGEQISLMHSELSEALEEYRNNGLDPSKFIYFNPEKPDKPEGIAVELADELIRIFDTCGRYQIPLAKALLLKMQYNTTRPQRHGGKVI